MRFRILTLPVPIIAVLGFAVVLGAAFAVNAAPGIDHDLLVSSLAKPLPTPIDLADFLEKARVTGDYVVNISIVPIIDPNGTPKPPVNLYVSGEPPNDLVCVFVNPNVTTTAPAATSPVTVDWLCGEIAEVIEATLGL